MMIFQIYKDVFNILGFANRLNDIFEYGGYESYGGKIKSKNKKKSRKTKRKTKRK